MRDAQCMLTNLAHFNTLVRTPPDLMPTATHGNHSIKIYSFFHFAVPRRRKSKKVWRYGIIIAATLLIIQFILLFFSPNYFLIDDPGRL